MVKTLVVSLGHENHKLGTILELDAATEEHLVSRGVAEYVDAPLDNGEKQSESPKTDTEEDFLSEDEIAKMKKEDLITYAESIGLKGLDMTLRLDDLRNALNNYIDELVDTDETTGEDE